MSNNITLSREDFNRVLDRFEARLPEPTRAAAMSVQQRSVNKRIAKDRLLIEEMRSLLQPSIQKQADDFGNLSLESLRLLREIAIKDGKTGRAFAIATAIDRARGIY